MPFGRGLSVPSRLARARQVPRHLLAPAAAALAAMLAVVSGGCASVLPRHYEYEEEIYLSLDGTATVYVNGSVPALVALRGLPLNVESRARVDRAALRKLYTSDITRVTRFSTSRRSGRRFVHLRVYVSDIRRLGGVAPFAWSSYSLTQQDDAYVYAQTVGKAAGRDVGNVGWKGDELVAFRMHLPSKIRYHNAPSKEVERGNILAWEQPLAARLAGTPVSIEVRLDTQSILYRTLWLFGLMIVLVIVMFIVLIGWIVRKGRARATAVS